MGSRMIRGVIFDRLYFGFISESVHQEGTLISSSAGYFNEGYPSEAHQMRRKKSTTRESQNWIPLFDILNKMVRRLITVYFFGFEWPVQVHG